MEEKKNKKNCHLTVAVHILQTREKSRFKEGKKKKGKLQSGEGPPCKSVPSAQRGPLLRACTSNTMATAAISIIYLLFFLLGGSHYVAEKTLLCLKERRAATRNRVFLFRPSWRRMRGKIFGWRCHVLTWRPPVSANVLYQCFITRRDMSWVHILATAQHHGLS